MFDGLKRGQAKLILDASQEANINPTGKTWTPKDSNGNSVVTGGGTEASLQLFSAVYCGKEPVL